MTLVQFCFVNWLYWSSQTVRRHAIHVHTRFADQSKTEPISTLCFVVFLLFTYLPQFWVRFCSPSLIFVERMFVMIHPFMWSFFHFCPTMHDSRLVWVLFALRLWPTEIFVKLVVCYPELFYPCDLMWYALLIHWFLTVVDCKENSPTKRMQAHTHKYARLLWR